MSSSKGRKAAKKAPAKKTARKKVPAENRGAGGRPSSFKPEYVEQTLKLCRLGATDKELADFFGVSEQTVNAWKKAHPEFLESLKAGKAAADAEVADKLFQRATGYEVETVKVFQFQGEPVIVPIREKYAPDPTSMIFWLKNRRPGKWRDKVDHEHAGPNGGAIPVISGTMTPTEAAAAYAATLNDREG